MLGLLHIPGHACNGLTHGVFAHKTWFPPLLITAWWVQCEGGNVFSCCETEACYADGTCAPTGVSIMPALAQ